MNNLVYGNLYKCKKIKYVVAYINKYYKQLQKDGFAEIEYCCDAFCNYAVKDFLYNSKWNWLSDADKEDIALKSFYNFYDAFIKDNVKPNDIATNYIKTIINNVAINHIKSKQKQFELNKVSPYYSDENGEERDRLEETADESENTEKEIEKRERNRIIDKFLSELVNHHEEQVLDLFEAGLTLKGIMSKLGSSFIEIKVRTYLVLYLFCWEEYTYEQIEKELGIPESTAENTIKKNKKILDPLRKQLSDY